MVLVVLTALSIGACCLLVWPFLPALAWALALAVVARPLHAWIGARVRNANLAAAASLALIVLILVGPALLVIHALVTEAAHGVELLQTEAATHPDSPLHSVLDWIDERVDIEREVRRVVEPLTADLASLLTGSIWAVAQFLIMLLTLFYFLRDQPKLLRAVRSLVPLSRAEAEKVLARIGDTIHATIYGTLLVAMVQGALGGLMFWWLGLPAPLLWAVVMALLAVIPWLGSFVVWAPATAVLFLQGSWEKGVILIVWGLIVVGLSDNLLYPMLVGNRLRLHTLLVFFAIVGGLLLFGAAGVVLGPVVLALTVALLDVWERRTRDGQTAEAGVTP
jgi:predicted PurR-regulated permease PerM